MSKQFIFSTLTALVLLASTSCKKEIGEIDQELIYPTYHVLLKYDFDSAKTYVSAKFFLNSDSSTKLLLDQGSIHFNDEVLSNDTIQDFPIFIPPFYFEVDGGQTASYKHEQSGFVQQGTFEFVDANNEKYINSVPYINEIAFADSAITAKLGDSLTVAWEGLPVQEGESVCFNGGLIVPKICINTVNATSLTIFIPDSVYTDDSVYVIPALETAGIFYRESTTYTEDNPNGRPDGGKLEVKYASKPFRINYIQ